MLLGVDLATVAAWCALSSLGDGSGGWEEGAAETGIINTKPRDHEREGARFHRFALRFNALLKDRPSVELVVYEEPYSQAYHAAKISAGYVTAMMIACEMNDVDYVGVNASTLKAFARREGVSKEADRRGKVTRKEGMRAWASERLGRHLTDDEADAWWVLQWHLAGQPTYS